MKGTETVRFDDAVRVLNENLETGKEYKLGDIRDVFEKHFPHINANQVSGLMTRLTRGDRAMFEVKRILGQRNTYVFTGEDSLGEDDVTVQEYVKETLQASIERLQKLSFGDMKSAEDFELLKNTEAKLKEMLKDL